MYERDGYIGMLCMTEHFKELLSFALRGICYI